MSVHSIKTGLGKKYKDMLSAVKGQMCDGYWENTPMMQGYWRFCKIGTAGDEVTIEVDDANGTRIDDRFIDNRFRGMPDDAIKKFFADKIKFLIKEEGLGKWDRGNENETDFLSYGEPRYRVKDCYYAYEILKGRDARKHPEYGDVAESNMMAGEGSIGRRLEDAAQATAILTHDDAWHLDMAAEEDAELRTKVRDLLNAFDDAAYADDDAKMKDAAKKLKELADGDTANSNEAFDGWDGWEEIEGLEDALDGIENLTYELRSCVRGAKTRCKDWKALARHIQNLASKLDDAAGEMAYKRDDEDESKKEKGVN